MRRALTLLYPSHIFQATGIKELAKIKSKLKEVLVTFGHFLFPSLRWTNRLHGPRLLHPESLSEQPTVSGLPGPSSGHPAKPTISAPGPLLLWPSQDARGPGQHPYPGLGKPIQLQVCQENEQPEVTELEHYPDWENKAPSHSINSLTNLWRNEIWLNRLYVKSLERRLNYVHLHPP